MAEFVGPGPSPRVQNGSATKGSVAINMGDELGAILSVDDFRQGANIRNVSDGFDALAHKLRSNSGFVRTIDGKDVPRTAFNDSISTDRLHPTSTGDIVSNIEGRVSQRITHEREQRDLGQSDVYVDGSIFFESANPDEPISVMGMLDRSEFLPAALVDTTSQAALDGKLDPLDTLRNTDRGGIDHPFPAKGVRGAAFHGYDLYGKCYELLDKYNVVLKDSPVTEFYLDAPEKFGPISLPAVVNSNVTKIGPFVDIDGQEKFVMENVSDPDMRQVLKGNNFVLENDLDGFDKLATGGFDYYDGPDSLSHGGLTK